MLAIFKRDFRAYYTSPIAYVVTGLFVAVLALFFTSSLNAGVASFSSGFSSGITYLFLFLIPLLTMRIFSEDKRNGTEVLLLTSPNRVTAIVLGKFLAAYSVLANMVLASFIYPLIMMIFGKPDVPVLLNTYLGILLYGAVCVSIGVFASSLTENQIVAASITFVTLLLMTAIDFISSNVGGFIGKVLVWLSLNERLAAFSDGILDLTTVVFMLSFVAVFVYLTVRVLEKKRWSQG